MEDAFWNTLHNNFTDILHITEWWNSFLESIINKNYIK